MVDELKDVDIQWPKSDILCDMPKPQSQTLEGHNK
jgi:hypothetical protein